MEMKTFFFKFSLSLGVGSEEAMGMCLQKSKQILGTTA